jgi:Tol biopolymer transport system component
MVTGLPLPPKSARVLAALLILASVTTGCSDSTAARPRDVDAMILFSAHSGASQTNALYGVMPDGTGLVKFAEKGLGQMLFPRRSRDRQLIVFSTGTTGASSIWTMSADVTGAHTEYNPGCTFMGNFSWSPGGDRLVGGCDSGEVVINVADGTSYSLTQIWGRPAITPDWSPVGDKILYHKEGFGSGFGGETFAANLDGSGETLLAMTAENAVWSPDGRNIAFERVLPSLSRVIFVANADGTGQRQLTFPADTTINDNSPAWSPDGTRLAFVRYQDTQPGVKFRLSVINADGSGLKSITADTLRILRIDW